MEIYQGSKGVYSSRDSGLCRGSGNISQAEVQLVSKVGIAEEVDDNISHQEKECSIP